MVGHRSLKAIILVRSQVWQQNSVAILRADLGSNRSGGRGDAVRLPVQEGSEALENRRFPRGEIPKSGYFPDAAKRVPKVWQHCVVANRRFPRSEIPKSRSKHVIHEFWCIIPI